MAATSQQAVGLHPFVSQIKIVDPGAFPDVSLISLNSEEWCEPVIADDFNIYTTKVTTVEQTKTVSLIKLQRQDFHENYFTATVATYIGAGTDGIKPISYDSSTSSDSTADLVKMNPRIIVKKFGTSTHLYLYYATRSYTGKNYVDNYNVQAFKITSSVHLSPLWNITGPVAAVDRGLQGFFYNSTTLFVYYLSDINLIIRGYNRGTGVETFAPLMITLDQIYTYCTVNMSVETDNTFYITVRIGTIVKMATYSIAKSQMSTLFNVFNTTGGTPVNPAFMSYLQDSAGLNMCSLVYGFNNDPNNIIQIAYIPNTVDSSGYINGLETPFYYNINKYALFSEVSNPSQSDMDVAIEHNPNNPDFSYIVYVAGTSQLRVMKIYRNSITGTYETHMPLVLWSTRLGAIGDTFRGDMGIVTDTQGSVYIISRDSSTGIMSIWKIKEYIIDLGHTEGTVVAPVDTIPNMLQTMTNDYTILTLDQNIHLAGFPTINDVTFDSITNITGSIAITFQYINYDLLQGFPSVVTQIKTLINNTFVTLYEDSGISVINMDQTGNTSIDGTDASLIVELPVGTAKKPCVVRGTEIIRLLTNNLPELVNVEHIQVGDHVLNHVGKPARVMDHMRTTVYAESHNAPYVIPKGFFGSNRPYKPLLISGDHGILVGFTGVAKTMKVVYANDIDVLSKVLIGSTVEYHHLLLENHAENFYIANGLEVDSYHPGIFMRK
jgi:hypothetical protein